MHLQYLYQRRGKKQTSAIEIERSRKTGGALILVDGSRIRKIEMNKYERSCKSLAREKTIKQNYEELDLPAFTAWLEAHFGLRLAEMIAKTHRVQELNILINDVELFAIETGKSPKRSYDMVRKARSEGKGVYDLLDEYFGVGGKSEAEDFLDEMSEVIEEMVFGEDEPCNEERYSDNHRTHSQKHNAHRVKSHADGPTADMAKSIYRQLTKLLHPDVNKASDQNLELWHQVQKAYQDQDVMRLRSILDFLTKDVASADGLDFDTIPVGILIRMRKEVESKLRRLKQELREIRNEPSWEFTKVTRNASLLSKLEMRIDKELSAEEHELGCVLTKMENHIANWQRPAARKNSRQKTKARSF